MTLTDPRLDALRLAMTGKAGQKQWAAIDPDANPPVHEFDSQEEAETHVTNFDGRVYRRLGHGLAWERVQ